MPFISVDIEASGPIPGVYDMISLGAVKVERTSDGYRPTDAQIYMEIKPFYGGVDEDAMAVNKLDLEVIKENGVTLKEAAEQLREWTMKQSTRRDPAVFVGYCANFDWAYVNDMFLRTEVENPFGYKALDIRALAMGLLKQPWLQLNQQTILPALEMEALDPKEAHHALVDARHQAHMLCRLLEMTGLENAIR